MAIDGYKLTVSEDTFMNIYRRCASLRFHLFWGGARPPISATLSWREPKTKASLTRIFSRFLKHEVLYKVTCFSTNERFNILINVFAVSLLLMRAYRLSNFYADLRCLLMNWLSLIPFTLLSVRTNVTMGMISICSTRRRKDLLLIQPSSVELNLHFRPPFLLA